MLSALSAAGRRAAPATPGAGGGRAASAAPGPRGPPGNGAILPGCTTPAPGRRGRAGPAPSRPSPAEAVLAPLSGSLHQPARKAGADSAPPRRLPGTAVLPAVLPAGARDAARRLRGGVDASPGDGNLSETVQSEEVHLPESQSRALKLFPVLASLKSQRLSPARMKMPLK